MLSLCPEHSRPLLAMSVPAAEVETSTPFLERMHHQSEVSASEPDMRREEESWTDRSDMLLYEWSSDWQRRASAHEAQETRARSQYYALQIPTALIPVVLAPLLTSHLVAEDSPVVVLLLVLSAAASGLQSMLRLERKSEQHAQAAFRYLDLVTDVEEVMAKERRFRPRCGVTIQRFKMRMDAANLFAPSVAVSPSRGFDSASEASDS